MQKRGKFLLFTVDEFDEWLQRTDFSRSITLVQNHHTYKPGYANFKGTNHFALLRGMEHFHMAERGFSEIAQNLTSFPDGTVAVCRPLDRVPCGIKGANQEGVCLENLGNFDAGEDDMTSAQEESIVKINALLCRKFGLSPSAGTIVYHHWYDLNSGLCTGGSGTTKTCPGTAFFGGNTTGAAQASFIPRISRALTELVGGVLPEPATPAARAEITAASLNVRTGQGTRFPVVASLKRGVRVSVYETGEGWCRIHPAQQQWVAQRYLRAVAEVRSLHAHGFPQ